MPVKLLTAVLLVLLAHLHWRLWVADGGFSHAHRLKTQIAAMEAELEQLRARNRRLAAEVQDFQMGSEAIESRARTALGMIDPSETFYLVVSDPRR